MSLGEKAFTVSAAIAVMTFSAACLAAGSWTLLPVPFVAAGAGAFSRRPRWAPLVGVGFAVLVCGCGVGIAVGLAPLPMLVVSLAVIAAWDADALARAARGTADATAARRVQKAHLLRLLAVLGAGALLGLAAMLLRHPLGLAVLLCAGFLLAFSLGALLRGRGRGR